MVEVNDACSASTSTIAGILVSGQVTIRWPRYLEEDRTSQRIPNQSAAASIAIAIIEPTAVSMFNPFLRLYAFVCSDRSSSMCSLDRALRSHGVLTDRSCPLLINGG